MLLGAIDPGLANGGAVMIDTDTDTILGVQRLTSKPLTPDPEWVGDSKFTGAIVRGRAVVEQVVSFFDEWKPERIAIESFVDLGSRRGMKNMKGEQQWNQNRWMTPLSIGMIEVELRSRKIPTQYQNPAILQQFSTEIAQLTEANKNKEKGKTRPDCLVLGDHLLSNDHLIKAWCHGSWAKNRL